MAIIGGEATSPFPAQNALYNGTERMQAFKQNELLQQSKQQEIGATDQEMVARASAYIDGLQPDQKPMAYASARRDLQSRGFALNAPAEYPGDETIKRLASMGTPSKDMLAIGANRDAAAAYGRSLGLGGTPGPGASAAPGGSGAAPGGTIEMPAQQRARMVYDGLIKRGMDADTATAFAANALHESAGNPNTGTGDGGASHGLFMWNGPRLQAYVAKYGHTPDNAPLDEQLDFVTHELAGSEAPAGARISQAQGAADKAAEVSRAYLRPRDTVPEMDRRSATATQLASVWGSPGQTTSAAPGTGGGVAGRIPGAYDVAGQTAAPSPAAQSFEPLLSNNLTASQAAQVQTRLSMRNPDINAIGDDVRAMQQNNLAIRRQAEQDSYQRQQNAETSRRAQEQLDLSNRADARAASTASMQPDQILAKYRAGMISGDISEEGRALYAIGAQHYMKPVPTWVDSVTEPGKKELVNVPGSLPEGYPPPNYRPTSQAQPQAAPAASPAAPAAPLAVPQPPEATQPPGVPAAPAAPVAPSTAAVPAPPAAPAGPYPWSAPAAPLIKTDQRISKPLPEADRKLLLGEALKLDQVVDARNTFKDSFAGYGSAVIGDAANKIAANTPGESPRVEWWKNYQKVKLIARQSISGQSLTEGERAEFEKSDINPGMSPETIRTNLKRQNDLLRIGQERHARALLADTFNKQAIEEASGIKLDETTARPAGTGLSGGQSSGNRPPLSSFRR